MLKNNEPKVSLDLEIEDEQGFYTEGWGSPALHLGQQRKLERANSLPNLLLRDGLKLKKSLSVLNLAAPIGSSHRQLKKRPFADSGFEEKNFSDYGSQEQMSVSAHGKEYSLEIIEIIEKLSDKITKLEGQLRVYQSTTPCLGIEDRGGEVSFLELRSSLAEFFSADERVNIETVQILEERTAELKLLMQKNKELEAKVLKFQESNRQLKAALEISENYIKNKKNERGREQDPHSSVGPSRELGGNSPKEQGICLKTLKNASLMFLVFGALVFSIGLAAASAWGPNYKLGNIITKIGIGLAASSAVAGLTYLGAYLILAKPKTNLTDPNIEGEGKDYYYNKN